MHQTMAAELTGRAIAEMESSLASYLRPIDEIVKLSVSFGRGRQFERRTLEELDTTFAAFLEATNPISSVHFATPSGKEYMLLQKPDGTYYNRLSDSADQGTIRERAWDDNKTGRQSAKAQRKKSGYDVRKTVWFNRAIEALRDAEGEGQAIGRVVWSDPYTFFTTKEPGITASIAYRTVTSTIEVLAFDILLTDIQSFAQKAQLGGSGLVFVLLRRPKERDLVVLAIPPEKVSSAGESGDVSFPLPVENLEGAPMNLVDEVFSAEPPKGGIPIRFFADGETWWGAVAHSTLSRERELWIAAAIPEDEVLEGIPNSTIITVTALLLTMLLAFVLARWLAAQYGEPITQLVSQTERIGRLNFSHEPAIVSPIYEVQMLATSQEEMRKSLAGLFEMNRRMSVAREFRGSAVPATQIDIGRFHLAMTDRPGDEIGGSIPLLFPVRMHANRMMMGSDRRNAFSVLFCLVDTQLSGMESARAKIALAAATRALLHKGVSGKELLGALESELNRGSEATAPVGVAACKFDGKRCTVQVIIKDQAPFMTVIKSSGEVHRQIFDFAPDAPQQHRHTVKIEPGDTLLITSIGTFDILDSNRRRLTPEKLENWAAEMAVKGADECCVALAERIEQFSGTSGSSVEIVLLAVTCA